jgi:hypothetical protein
VLIAVSNGLFVCGVLCMLSQFLSTSDGRYHYTAKNTECKLLWNTCVAIFRTLSAGSVSLWCSVTLLTVADLDEFSGSTWTTKYRQSWVLSKAKKQSFPKQCSSRRTVQCEQNLTREVWLSSSYFHGYFVTRCLLFVERFDLQLIMKLRQCIHNY